jgi:hypothetical protein
LDSLEKPHAFVADEFPSLDGIQRIDCNINAAPECIVEDVLGGVI